MNRLKAATTPALFFVGLALICSALIQFQRRPFVARQLFASDFEEYEPVWRPDVRSWLRPLHLSGTNTPMLLVALGLLSAAGVALVGLIISVRGRREPGATLIMAGALSGGFLLGLATLSSPPRICDDLLLVTEAFAAFIALLLAGAVLAQPRATLPTLAGAAIAVAMVAVTIGYAGASVSPGLCGIIDWADSVLAPPWPRASLLSLLGIGLVLSFTRPPQVSPAGSALVMICGLALGLPALAIASDERIEIHPAPTIPIARDLTTAPTTRCSTPPLVPVITVTTSEIMSSGVVLGTIGGGARVEQPVAENLVEMRKRYEDLHAQAGDPDPPERRLSIYADRTMPLDTLAAIARASAGSGFTTIEIISVRDWPIRVWTLPLKHIHFCATQVELADDGQPLSDFADWPSLVKAADLAEGRLRISVK